MLQNNQGYTMGKEPSMEIESERVKNIFMNIESAILSDKVGLFCSKLNEIWNDIGFDTLTLLFITDDWCAMHRFYRPVHQ